MNKKRKSNLLLVTFDQWRGDWGDPYNEVVPLPTFKNLARNGWTARRCYTSSPHCVPARFSWITGLEPSQLGVTKNKAVDLPRDAPSIVRQIQEEGYYTALVGKTHWTRHDERYDLRNNLSLMKELGFNDVIEIAGPRALRRINCDLTEDWERNGVKEKQENDLRERYADGKSPKAWKVRETILPLDLYPDIWVANKAKEKLKTIPDDKPWMLWVSFVGPHEPFDTPKPWAGKNNSVKLPDAKRKPDWIAELPKRNELRQLSDSWDNKLKPREIKECRRDYADHIQLLDKQLELIIEVLKQRKDYKNTAIVVTADHGELLGDAEMLYKGCFLEGAIHVPWIYQEPQVKRKTRNMQINTAIPLTALLKRTVENLQKGGSANELINWAKKQKGAVVEFGKERLIIQGERKMALDETGKPVWAVHIGRDKDEAVNVITQKNIRWIFSPRWSKIRRWGKEITKERSKKLWVWRDLGANS